MFLSHLKNISLNSLVSDTCRDTKEQAEKETNIIPFPSTACDVMVRGDSRQTIVTLGRRCFQISHLPIFGI